MPTLTIAMRRSRSMPKSMGWRAGDAHHKLRRRSRFQEDVLKMIEELDFRRVNDECQKSWKRILIGSRHWKLYLYPPISPGIFTRWKKTIRKASPRECNQDLSTCTGRNVRHEHWGTKDCHIARVADRLEVLAHRDATLTLKDHKENFPNSFPCRLINPAKSEIGLINKRLLDHINTALREKTRPSAVEELADAMAWFSAIWGKHQSVFTSFDICEFYPSVGEGLLLKALRFARQSTDISEEEINTILHARKSLLFSGGRDWIKRTEKRSFNVRWEALTGRRYAS